MKSSQLFLTLLVLAFSANVGWGTIGVFSAGMVVPETISLSPSGFTAYPGHYFVPDPASSPGNLHIIHPAGGSPVTALSIGEQGNNYVLGGLFLPDGFGDHGGKYLVVGSQDLTHGKAWLVDKNLDISNLTTITLDSGQCRLSQPALVPDGFGSWGGQVFVTDQFSLVRSIDSTGQDSIFADLSTYTELGTIESCFGLAFAPEEFGTVGGSLLVEGYVTETGEDVILSIDSAGNISHFTTIPMTEGQRGLRQMSFAPPDFGDYGGELFVSVSGSSQGGGALGSLHAVNSNGSIVATLKAGSQLDKFDPRGVFFREDGMLLISDASDPILIAGADDFAAVPEPASIVVWSLLATLGITLGWRRRTR
jgi:hypothetical protein